VTQLDEQAFLPELAAALPGKEKGRRTNQQH